MNGIQALLPQGQPQMPGQAPMPGQAAMPGMQPGAGGPPPGISSDRIPDLAKLNEQMLIQLFNLSMTNQIQKPSPISILSAISEKQKQKQAAQAVAGAMAQGQNAQNQQSGTVAQEILGPLMQQQAAQDGEMHGYAGGGIVAFQSGTAERGLPYAADPVPAQPSPVIDQREVDRILKKAPMARTPEENDLLRAAGVSLSTRLPAPEGTPIQRVEEFLKKPFIREAVTGGAHTLSPDELAQRTDVGAITERAFRALGGSQAEAAPTRSPTSFIPVEDARRRGDIPPEGMPVASPSRGGEAGSREDAAKVRRQPPVRVPPAITPTTPAAPSAADQELQNYLSSLRTRQGVPEDVAAGRAGLESLVREEMKARQDRLAQDRAAAEERRKEALERAPGVFSPEGLLGIAASIDPRRGYELGSAARGAFGIMGAQRKAQEEARREFREFEKSERTEQNLLSQMRILEVQRQQAIREGDATKANEITDKIYATQRDIEKFNAERAEKKRQFDIQELAAQAEMEKGRAGSAGAAATREATEFARLSQIYGNQRANLVDDLRLETEKHREQNKMIYQMAQLGVDKMTPEQQKQLADAEVALKVKLDAIRNSYAMQMGPLAERLGLGLPAGVKVKKTGP